MGFLVIAGLLSFIRPSCRFSPPLGLGFLASLGLAARDSGGLGGGGRLAGALSVFTMPSFLLSGPPA